MTELEDITYSREGTIAAITEYYKFLTSMYVRDSRVIYPPPKGWPSIINADPHLLQSFGKSDEVIALLAHLPYIQIVQGDEDVEAAPYCVFADWQFLIECLGKPASNITSEGLHITTEGATFAELCPPHVVGLTFGGRDNPVMVLDTKLGIIHWEDCFDQVEREYGANGVDYEPGDDDDASEEEVAWRESATAWAIPDFFENLKAQFIKLNWIPISPYSVRSTPMYTSPDEEDIVLMLQGIYHQHGWPDLATYRKLDCLEAVQAALIERYPSHACSSSADRASRS